jgi:hypothetical protein
VRRTRRRRSGADEQPRVVRTRPCDGQTKQICFEGWALVIFDYLHSSCFVPKTNNLVISTNG